MPGSHFNKFHESSEKACSKGRRELKLNVQAVKTVETPIL